jgi:DNA-binding response OmpR family regulator/HPt (histidine-containing phosphotransfer) domain-containing protein
MRILLVEDDQNLTQALVPVLCHQNYIVDVATDGEMGWDMARTVAYDLALLDVELPRLDGVNLCCRLRNHQQLLPVMLMTVRESLTDKLTGLDSGADDYLVKPFDMGELLARIRVLSRRLVEQATSIISCGNICLNLESREVTCNGQLLSFTCKEYLIMELLLRHPQRVFSRRDIVDHVWSLTDFPTEDTIKSHIRRIRLKLHKVGAEDLIETLYGHGYRINPTFLHQEDSNVEVSSSQAKELSQAIGQVWQSIQARVWNQVGAIEQVLEQLQTNSCDQQDLEAARKYAHQLAGTTGTCGFEAASHIARAIEAQLQTPSLTGQRIASLAQLVQVLRSELESPPAQNLNQDACVTDSFNLVN